MTLEQIRQRHSVRSFSPRHIPEDIVNTLKAELTMVNTHEAGLHLTLHLEDNAPMATWNRSYGFFRNAINYIAVTVDHQYPDVEERAGFFAEEIVLKAVGLGLGTCFIGGTYRSSAIPVPLRAGQEVLFLIAVGLPDVADRQRPLARLTVGFAHLKKMDWQDFYIVRGEWTLAKAQKEFPYLKKGLQAVACAPSSLNKRPVRVWIGHTPDDRPVVRIGIPSISPRQFIDLGIAKYNFAEVAGNGYWDWGNGAAYNINE